MNIGTVLHELFPDGRRAVRNIENTSRKITNARASVAFNKICIDNNLLPKFTNIYIYIYIHATILFDTGDHRKRGEGMRPWPHIWLWIVSFGQAFANGKLILKGNKIR